MCVLPMDNASAFLAQNSNTMKKANFWINASAAIVFVIIVGLLLSGCSKERKYRRKLKGEWEITSYAYQQQYNDECGVNSTDVFYEWEAKDAGTIDFTGEEAGEDFTGEVLYEGEMEFDYTTTDSWDREITVQSTLAFTYWVWKDLDSDWWVTIQNQEEFLYETWPLEDLNRKTFNFSYGAGHDCWVELWSFECEQ